MNDILSLLNFLGITPTQIIPMILVVGSAYFVAWKSFGKPLRQELISAKDELTDLHNATKEIQMHLGRDKRFSPQHSLEQKPIFNQYGKHASPMQPSRKGQRLLKQSGFYNAYHELQKEIFRRMDAMHLRTKYDYEAGASSVLMKLSNEPAMDQLKDYAVNHPDENLELIFGVASWVIRDDYTEYRKNNSSTKIDNRDT